MTPQDFSPDADPVDRFSGESNTLPMFLRRALQIPDSAPTGNLHNQTAQALDEAAIKSGTQDFDPGFEVCLADNRSEVVDIKSVFYQASQDPFIHPREMRVRYRSLPSDRGAVPGQLTSGLCSPWQGDFTACIGYWSEHLPTDGYLDEDSSIGVELFRKEYDDYSASSGSLRTGDDFTDHVDKIGVARIRNSKRIETERDPGDDIP